MAANPATSLSDPAQEQAYPPRLLAPGISYWLDEGAHITLVPDQLTAWCKDGVCYISCSEEAPVLVNGQPFLSKWVLRDGDFIHCGKYRFIFQADPEAAKRARLAESAHRPPKLSRHLMKRVLLNSRALSIDGGKTFIRWSDLFSLDVIVPISRMSQYARGIRVRALMREGRSAELDHISGFDLRRLFGWLSAAAPIDVSIRNPLNAPLPITDAYVLAAQSLMKRIESGQTDVGEVKRRFVLGEPVRFQRLGWAVFMLLVGGSWLGLTCVMLPSIIANMGHSGLVDATGTLTADGMIVLGCLGGITLIPVVMIVYGLIELFRTLTAPSGH